MSSYFAETPQKERLLTRILLYYLYIRMLQLGGKNFPPAYLRFCARYKRNSNCYTHVFGSAISMVVLALLSDVTGSGKSKMAAAKLEIPISRLVVNIARKFQRLCLCFGSRNSNGVSGNPARPNRKWKIEDGGL